MHLRGSENGGFEGLKNEWASAVAWAEGRSTTDHPQSANNPFREI
jgi:hypothetical protein